MVITVTLGSSQLALGGKTVTDGPRSYIFLSFYECTRPRLSARVVNINTGAEHSYLYFLHDRHRRHHQTEGGERNAAECPPPLFNSGLSDVCLA